MNKETRQALEASIKHWEKNTQAKRPDEASVWGSDCQLCTLFYEHHTCADCPVRQHTGRRGCWGTPYHPAAEAHSRWKVSDTKINRDAFIGAAKTELDFLKMLLKKGEDDAV